jgi:hypothetical protein
MIATRFLLYIRSYVYEVIKKVGSCLFSSCFLSIVEYFSLIWHMRRKTAKRFQPGCFIIIDISKIDHACRGSKRVLSRFKQKWVKCAHHKKLVPQCPGITLAVTVTLTLTPILNGRSLSIWRIFVERRPRARAFRPWAACTVLYDPHRRVLAFRLVRTKQPFEPPLCPKAHRPDKGEPPSWPSQRIPYRPIWTCLVLYGQNHGERRAHRS